MRAGVRAGVRAVVAERTGMGWATRSMSEVRGSHRSAAPMPAAITAISAITARMTATAESAATAMTTAAASTSTSATVSESDG